MVERLSLEQWFNRFDKRLAEIERKLSRLDPETSELLELPSDLRTTYLVLTSKGESDAMQVSSVTKRCRAVESLYLNRLVRLGWASKRRNGKSCLFSPVHVNQRNLEVNKNK